MATKPIISKISKAGYVHGWVCRWDDECVRVVYVRVRVTVRFVMIMILMARITRSKHLGRKTTSIQFKIGTSCATQKIETKRANWYGVRAYVHFCCCILALHICILQQYYSFHATLSAIRSPRWSAYSRGYIIIYMNLHARNV